MTYPRLLDPHERAKVAFVLKALRRRLHVCRQDLAEPQRTETDKHFAWVNVLRCKSTLDGAREMLDILYW